MADYRLSLESVLGQRPFAYVPNEIARAGKGLSHGAVSLYATLSAMADDEGGCYGSAHDLGLYMGASPRSVQRWIRELERLPDDVFMAYREPGRANEFLVQSRAEITEPGTTGGFAYVPLLSWNCDWTGLEWRVWIVLWSYSGKNHGCYVGMELLAKDCGADASNVRKARHRLELARLVHVVYHRRASSDTLLYDGKKWNKPAHRRGVKHGTGQRLKGATGSPDQGHASDVLSQGARQDRPTDTTASPEGYDTLTRGGTTASPDGVRQNRPQGTTASPPYHKTNHKRDHETNHETNHETGHPNAMTPSGGMRAGASGVSSIKKNRNQQPFAPLDGDELEAERARQLAATKASMNGSPKPATATNNAEPLNDPIPF